MSKPKTCGTRNGYYRHLYRGEEPCGPCRDANRSYGTDRRRAAGVRPIDEYHADQSARAAVDNPCGTLNAYKRHLYRSETPCELCRAANREASCRHREARKNG